MARASSLLRTASLAIMALAITGCATTVEKVDPGVPGERTELDRGYATLADLLADERKVHQILPIKSEGMPVRILVQEIAATSAEADDRLKNLAALAPPVNLKQPTDLPMIEQATRDSIATETALDLLLSNDSFETRLMLSQAQALQYGRFLALKLKEADPNTERQTWLTQLAGEYERLYKQLVNDLHGAVPANAESTATVE